MWRNGVKILLYCNIYCGSTVTSYPVCLVRWKPHKIQIVSPWFSCHDGKLMLSRISFFWEDANKFLKLLIYSPKCLTVGDLCFMPYWLILAISSESKSKSAFSDIDIPPTFSQLYLSLLSFQYCMQNFQVTFDYILLWLYISQVWSSVNYNIANYSYANLPLALTTRTSIKGLIVSITGL